MIIGAYSNKRVLFGYIGPLSLGHMNTKGSCQKLHLQMATLSWLLALRKTAPDYQSLVCDLKTQAAHPHMSTHLSY